MPWSLQMYIGVRKKYNVMQEWKCYMRVMQEEEKLVRLIEVKFHFYASSKIKRGTTFMAINSWNSSFAAYGMVSLDTFFEDLQSGHHPL